MNAKKNIYTIVFISALSLMPSIVFSQTDTIEKTKIEDEMFSNDSTTFEIDSLNEVVLSEAQIDDFTDKAIRKVAALSNYISTIGNKSKDDVQKDNAIDQAVKLFMNENCIVEVSSLRDTIIHRSKIRVYLRKLRYLPFDEVTIKWLDLYFASNFKLRPDGKYEAVATITQEFSAVTKEGGTYRDITEKNILIVIDRREILPGQTYWDTFLGDIKVVETKQL